MKSQFYDRSEFPENVFRKTAEGYLTGRVCVTGAGVFSYLGADGKTEVRRLRPRADVESATASLDNKPVTLQHPDEEFSPRTWRCFLYNRG